MLVILSTMASVTSQSMFLILSCPCIASFGSVSFASIASMLVPLFGVASCQQTERRLYVSRPDHTAAAADGFSGFLPLSKN